MKYYVLGIWGDVEPLPLQGPYDTEEERDLKAREMKKNDDTDEGGIYRLNINDNGFITVESYSGIELNPEYNEDDVEEQEESKDPMFKAIDDMSFEDMLYHWRFDEPGNTLFQGEIGDYFTKIMQEKQNKLAEGEFTLISKRIGWKKKQ
jgi:hypothetical protein